MLIVDDDFYVREAMEMLLSRDPRTTVVDTAGSPEEAYEKFVNPKENLKADLILTDLKFENSALTGIDLVKKIRSFDKDIKILITSMNREEKYVLSAINSGASGFIWKNESGDSIAAAIQKTYEGRFVVTKSVAEMILGKAAELVEYSLNVLPENKSAYKLSEELRKTMYLYCLCGMSTKEISEELSVSTHAVNSRIRAGYQILKANNRTDAFQELVKLEDDPALEED